MVTNVHRAGRAELRKSIADNTVVVSSNGLQTSLVSYGSGGETRVRLASAMGDRDAASLKFHADRVLEAALQRYERGLAEIVDVRLEALVGLCRDGHAEELAGEIRQLRFALGQWGERGNLDLDHLPKAQVARAVGVRDDVGHRTLDARQ